MPATAPLTLDPTRGGEWLHGRQLALALNLCH